MELKKGKELFLSYGEYADYGVIGHVRVLQDFDLEEQARRFSASDEATSSVGSSERFVEVLVKEGLVESREVVELNLADCGGNLDMSRLKK